MDRYRKCENSKVGFDSMEAGKISVIMGIYNCADTLSEAIDSILKQTYENWELILCDDGSTDSTYKIADQYREKHLKKIILIRNEINSKLAYTLNHCLKYATGEYVARMDGDDRLDPKRFEIQVNYLQTHPEIDLIGSSMRRFDDTGLHGLATKPIHPNKKTLQKTVPFNHATIMTYKKVYDTLQGYTVSDRTIRVEDYDLWFRFFAAGFRGDNIQEPLYYVREDNNTYRRRKMRDRINGIRTAYQGCTLLGYHKTWFIKMAIIELSKLLIPQQLIRAYHKKSQY